MRRLSKVLSAMLVGGCLSLAAAPAHAGWGFSFSRGFWNDHGNNGNHYGEDKGDKGNQGGNTSCDNGSPSTSSAVPEIDPGSIGTLFAIVGGGVALVTARRRHVAK